MFLHHCFYWANVTFTLAIIYSTLFCRLCGHNVKTDAIRDFLNAWYSCAVLQWWLHNIWVLLLVNPVFAFKTHAVLSLVCFITLPLCVHCRFVCCVCWSSIKYLTAALKCSLMVSTGYARPFYLPGMQAGENKCWLGGRGGSFKRIGSLSDFSLDRCIHTWEHACVCV